MILREEAKKLIFDLYIVSWSESLHTEILISITYFPSLQIIDSLWSFRLNMEVKFSPIYSLLVSNLEFDHTDHLIFT